MREKNKYVIGFEKRSSIVYGKDVNGFSYYCYPMSFDKAKKDILTLEQGKINRVIYKLVPVKKIK